MASAGDEDAMMLDLTEPAKATAASDTAYLDSLEATWPARPFALFDLPRELRDSIYDYALVEDGTFKLVAKPTKTSDENEDPDLTARPEDSSAQAPEPPTLPPSPSLYATVKFRASTNVLLAGNALKQEYEERAKQNMLVILQDHDHYSFQPVMPPTQATSTQNLELHLILFCHNCAFGTRGDANACHAAGELQSHRTWIEQLIPELRELRSLVIHAYLAHDRYRAGTKQKLPCELIIIPKFHQLSHLPHVRQIMLYKYDYHLNPNLDGPKELITEWTLRDGVRNIEVQEPEPEKVEQTTVLEAGSPVLEDAPAEEDEGTS